MTAISEPAAVDWYFDLISPFAYMQLQTLEAALPARIVPRPILLGAVLKHWGQLGPAEIEPKRLHTYRLCQFIADSRGIPFRFPDRHPFNPLKAMRLLAALGPTLDQVRQATAFVFAEGRGVDDPDALAELAGRLDVDPALADGQDAKDRLRASTDEAIARGVFGVPTIHVDGQLFWGDDATAMAAAYLRDKALFSHGEMARIETLEVGVRRNA